MGELYRAGYMERDTKFAHPLTTSTYMFTNPEASKPSASVFLWKLHHIGILN